MADLIARTPLAGQGPVTHGALTLLELTLGQMTSIMPQPRMKAKLATALKTAGLAWPAPNRAVAGQDARVIWTGRDQAFFIGALPDGLDALATLTDQSDGWACLSLQGAGAADVLMRLVPVDLTKMRTGDTVRSLLGHMSAVILRGADGGGADGGGADGFDILVFRSMAKTAWHEIEVAMRSIAARQAAGC